MLLGGHIKSWDAYKNLQKLDYVCSLGSIKIDQNGRKFNRQKWLALNSFLFFL
jgi:hypothetical protein